MFTLLTFFFAISLTPLEYIPYFDTYSDLYPRASEQAFEFKQSTYDGDLQHTINAALDDELNRVYQAILSNLNLDQQSLHKELSTLKISLSDKQLTELTAFRQKERKRLEKEQAAWLDCKAAYASLIYSIYAQGSARLVYPLYHNNSWTHRRICELRKRYPGVFSQSIQYKHIWGEWKQPEKEASLTFQRFRLNDDDKERKYLISTPSDDFQGTYKLIDGSLHLTETNKTHPLKMWIDILDENDSLYLELYQNPTLTKSDDWIYEIVERALLSEVEKIYQAYRIRSKEHLKELNNVFPDLVDDNTAYIETELEDFQKAQEAWQQWMAASYDTKEQMLPDGTSIPQAHSLARNSAIYDWIAMIREDIYDLRDTDSSSNISPDIFFGEWKCDKRDEIWNFSKKDNAYCYQVFKNRKLLESGTYHLNKVQLELIPTGSSRQIQTISWELNDSESHFWFKYLFGPLKLKDRYKKLAPL